MNRYALTVVERLSDLAHEVLVEDVGAVVDNMLDEAGTTTLVFSSSLRPGGIVLYLDDYLPPGRKLEMVS